MPRNQWLACLALIAGTVASGCASDPPPPAPYSVGSQLAPATLEDQHGVEQTLDETVRVVLFGRDMDGAQIIRDALGQDPGLLERAHAVYVADISGMPTLIANMMAIPSMRKRPYAMLLDRDGKVTAAYPSEEGKATLIRVDALEIREIEYVAESSELQTRLEAPAP